LPELTASDRALQAALEENGTTACAAIWSSGEIDWSNFDAVVIRSCWDYHVRVDEFLRWIDHLESTGVRLMNSESLIRWNADKRYLRELEAKGIAIPGTVWLEDGDEVELSEICRAQDWQRPVVKPLISASAYRTERGNAGLVRGPMMIQQYLPAIEQEGEWSLLYFAGTFSHAVRKMPRAGDFRVQGELGGTAELADPPAEIRRVADQTMGAISEQPVFARVDMVRERGTVCLMEIELIEPDLFLPLAPGAAQRLASAIRSALRGW
jgi:glutathione synthase/RimK-type ligase-like ATP-grasp enzyme